MRCVPGVVHCVPVCLNGVVVVVVFFHLRSPTTPVGVASRVKRWAGHKCARADETPTFRRRMSRRWTKGRPSERFFWGGNINKYPRTARISPHLCELDVILAFENGASKGRRFGVFRRSVDFSSKRTLQKVLRGSAFCPSSFWYYRTSMNQGGSRPPVC